MSTLIMKSSTLSPRSLGQQIIRGLTAGCIILIFTDIVLDMGFLHNLIRSLAAAKLWDATVTALLFSAMVLLLASGVMSFFKPKLAFWGMIISLLAIFVAVSFAPDFIEL